MGRKQTVHSGRVIETVGRRVVVADAEGVRTCFLSGQRAVLGDEVGWVEAQGSGGKLVSVAPRRTALCRVGANGREQVLAANLGGLVIVSAVQSPPFRAGLVDRYLVAAWSAGLEALVCLNKTDLGVPEQVLREVALRRAHGVRFVQASATDGDGIIALAEVLEEVAAHQPWALVGHSGVGKTSLIGALLPNAEVGPVGALSEYWGTGTHTTTRHRLFRLPGGAEIVDSPGIRTFTPSGLQVSDLRRHFPGMSHLQCQYRDCLHREGEDGCVADETIGGILLSSYRRMLADLVGVEARRRKY